jgi:hypothetical protein
MGVAPVRPLHGAVLAHALRIGRERTPGERLWPTRQNSSRNSSTLQSTGPSSMGSTDIPGPVCHIPRIERARARGSVGGWKEEIMPSEGVDHVSDMPRQRRLVVPTLGWKTGVGRPV